jgi:hypothetical protein
MPETDVAAFLRSLPEFRQSPPRALDELAGRCEVWSFGEGDLVRFADEAPDGRLWVGEGCLAAARSEEPARFIGVREEADVPVGHWVRGQTPGWYVRLPHAAWYGWKADPARVFRPSPLLPAVRLVLPVLFALLFVGLGAALSSLGTQVAPWALWLLPGAGIAAAAVWAALITLEWKRSYVALTANTLEIRRLDLGAREAVFETIASDRVREAVYTRKGWWGWLGLVALEIETDVPGGGPGARFRFDGLPADCPLVEALGNLPKAVDGVSHRQAWASKAGRAPVLVRPAAVEDAWFRRHWWLLAGKCLPWLGWCALVAFVAAWAAGLWPRGTAFCAMAGFAAALFPLGRIGWEVWDWADDRFGVTGSHVVLRRRRPFWLGETRQEVPLDQVEQVGVRRSGLAALILDFGAVTVRLGTADPLEFEGLARPERARRTVIARRDAVLAQQGRQAAAARFDEVADIIQTWDEAQKNGYGGVKP